MSDVTVTDNNDNIISIQQIEDNIETLRLYLEKKLLNPIKDGANVWIRDILATHPSFDINQKSIYGDFTIEEDLPNGQSRKTETDQQLVKRMLDQIIELANYAKDIHLKRNFKCETSQPLTLSSTMSGVESLNLIKKQLEAHENASRPILKYENEITRISTNEFFFYPNQARGPLCEKDFTDLLIQLESLAKKLPQNLHLVLGTMPVLSDRVRNVSIYIECGLEPRIHTQTKSATAHNDPLYNNKLTLAYTDFIKDEHFIHKLMNVNIKLLANLLNQPVLNFQEILHCTQNVLSHCNHPLYCAETDFVSKLENLLLDAHMQMLSSSQASIYARELLILYAAHVQHINATMKTLKQKYGQPQTHIFAVTQEGIHIPFSANFTSYTAAKTPITIATDICLDHADKKSKKQLKKELKDTNKSLDHLLPEHITHMVLSNSISLKKNAILTHDEIAIHNDPESPCIGKDGQSYNQLNIPVATVVTNEKDYPTLFGPSACIRTYIRRSVKSHSSTLSKDVITANQRTIHLQAMRLYRTQHPYLYFTLTELIQKKILEFLLDDIQSLSSCIFELNLMTLVDNFTDSLGLAILDQTNFRNEALTASDKFTKDVKTSYYDIKLARKISKKVEDFIHLLKREQEEESNFMNEIKSHINNSQKQANQFSNYQQEVNKQQQSLLRLNSLWKNSFHSSSQSTQIPNHNESLARKSAIFLKHNLKKA